MAPSQINGLSHGRNNEVCHLFLSFVLGVLQILIPSTLVLGFIALLVTHVAERVAHTYLYPQIYLNQWNAHRATLEQTYPARECTVDVVSTNTTKDLRATNMNLDESLRLFQEHGVVLIDDVLSESTATSLREFILEENERNTDHVPIFNSENRWSFEIQIDHHPSVAQAAREILSHPQLVQLLEAIVGDKNPAVLECTAITVQPGAHAQPYHSDSGPGANVYARTFVPAYSLFVALQNTTTRMGATNLCPGTHICVESELPFCEDVGFSLAEPVWPVGAVAILSQQTMHQGAAHTDPEAPARVVFYLTVAPRPRWSKYQVETRTLAFGGTTGQHWTQWGFTIADYRDSATRMKWPWRIVSSLGLYKRGQWGWDYITLVLQDMGKQDAAYNDDKFAQMIAEKGGEVPDDQDQGFLAYGYYMHVLKGYQRWLLKLYLAICFMNVCFLCIELLRQRRIALMYVFMVALIIHIIVFFLAVYWWVKVSQTSWARNILAGRNARPRTNISDYEAYKPEEFYQPDLDDILILDHIQSKYLGSLSDELNRLHPGNKAFQAIIADQAESYERLPIFRQQSVCDSILDQVDEEGRRILTKDIHNDWVEVLVWEDVYRFLHKELTKAADPLLRAMIMELDSLLSETIYGYWRDTDLHRRVLPPYLLTLQNKIMRFDYSKWRRPRDQEKYHRSPFVVRPLAARMVQVSGLKEARVE